MSLKYLGGYTGARPAWSRTKQSGVWSLYDRFTQEVTVTQNVTCAAGATVVGEFQLTSPCIITKVRLRNESWIRFYDSIAARNNDVARLVTEDPFAGRGVHLEIRTPGDQEIRTGPIPYMFSRQPDDDTMFPFRLTNESGVADVTVDVTYLPIIFLE